MPVHDSMAWPADGGGWILERLLYDPSEDGFFESLFALSNGRIGLRATVDFDAGHGQPGFFHYDLYGPAITVPSHLVNGFNPSYWRLFVDGRPIAIDAKSLVSFNQRLDLRTAKTVLSFVVRNASGQHTRVRRETFIPAQHAERIIMTNEVEALDHDLPLTLFVGFDWREGNGDLGGTQSAVRINNLVSRNVDITAGSIAVDGSLRGSDRRVMGRLSSLPTGIESYSVRERHRAIIAFQSSKGHLAVETRASVGPDPDHDVTTAEHLALMNEPLPAVADLHAEIWHSRWARATLVDGPQRDTYGLRYAQFQLFQCADRHRSSSNVAARGLTSEYHSGHFFFNTEFYVGPYYAITEPNVAKSFLRFRGETLKAAEQYAKDTGFRGARFPEEVDRNGNPASPRLIRDPFSASERREWSGEMVFHLSADVLHFLSAYLDASDDQAAITDEFLPLIVRCAEYLADLLRFDEAVGSRGARRVMCFDEFHYDVNHHVATNVLAAWALRWAASQLDMIEATSPYAAPRIDALGANRKVRQAWRDIAEETFVPPPRDDGVWPIFNGYFDLQDQLRIEDESGHLPRIELEDQQRADNLQPFSTTLAKQADIVFLMTILPGLVDTAVLAKNLAYYEPRTVHGSSLSLAPHAHAAALVGDVELARRLIVQSARYNLDFRPRAGFLNGVHFGAYAGAILAAIRGIIGFESHSNDLSFNPALPADWRELRTTIAWRQWKLSLRATPEMLFINEVGGERQGPLKVLCRGTSALLRPGGEVIFRL